MPINIPYHHPKYDTTQQQKMSFHWKTYSALATAFTFPLPNYFHHNFDEVSSGFVVLDHFIL